MDIGETLIPPGTRMVAAVVGCCCISCEATEDEAVEDVSPVDEESPEARGTTTMEEVAGRVASSLVKVP